VTTTDNERAQLLEAAQRIQTKQIERETKFRAFMCSRLGLGPGAVQAEHILSLVPKEMSDAQLSLIVHFDSGIPPEYALSEEQVFMAARALAGQIE
jgi:hypothetical protein